MEPTPPIVIFCTAEARASTLCGKKLRPRRFGAFSAQLPDANVRKKIDNMILVVIQEVLLHLVEKCDHLHVCYWNNSLFLRSLRLGTMDLLVVNNVLGYCVQWLKGDLEV